jgi:hypothetical protein
VNEGLLLPARVERIAKEMQTYYVQSMKARQARALEAPRELQELTARIERLRERLKHGDPVEALKARSTLRELFCGRVDLMPDENGELWAEYGLQPAALLQTVSNRGSGGRI